jgi:hypothetical protein
MLKRRAWICTIVFCFLAMTPALHATVFGKNLARGAQLPRTAGIGIDIFAMDQGYVISDLSFTAAGFPAIAVDGVDVENSLTEFNLKADIWLWPFLNVFAIYGEIDGTTSIDFRNANVALPFDSLEVDYDGSVYGGGVTLAIGTQRYFGSLTYSYSESDLQGDFNSSIEAQVWLPKVGITGDRGAFWVGGFYLDSEEKHTGSLVVPVLGSVAFDTTLAEEEALSYVVGGSINWGDHFTLTMEGGFSDRTTTLISGAWRF